MTDQPDGGRTRLSDAEFRMLTELLRGRCGLHFGEDARLLLEKRISRRLADLNLPSFSAYHYKVRSSAPDQGEFARLVDELTTNETYFFRERGQLDALVGELIPEAMITRRATGAGPVAIWSAGCSGGEEPYSIVMLGLEAGLVPGVDFRVYAADISQRVLKKARQGLYRQNSFRETDVRMRDRYFMDKEGSYRISDEVKKHVSFVHLNLLDRPRIALLRAMDVILCRNVIIYFNAETKAKVIQTFHDKLKPGGHLLLGHAESLINLSSSFQLRHLRNDMVYRRPLPGAAPTDPWHAAATRAVELADGEEP